MLSRFSVKRPYTVVVGVVLALILGVVSFTNMQTDLLPDMTLPYAIVYTSYPGASPEEVESIVTRPVEQSMATISNIETINSVSSENISMVVLEFAQSANMDAVTIEMRENLDQLEGYWDDSIGSPMIMKLNPDMMPIMVAAVEAGEMTSAELTDYINEQILPELESVEGVASVSTAGTVEERVEVVLRQEKIDEVNRKIRDALDGKFQEAEEELAEAEEKLAEGKEEMQKGQDALAEQTALAESQLSQGQSELIRGEAGIDSKLLEVTSQLASMETKAEELKAKEEELKAAKEQLDALPEKKEALKSQLASLENAIALLDAAPGQLQLLLTQKEQLDQLVSTLEALENQPGTNVPDGETPDIEIPDIEIPNLEMPTPEGSVPEAPETEAPVPETPETEAPVPEAPETEAPVPEALETEAPVPEAPETEAPVPEAPETEVPVPEAPVTETLVTEPETAAVIPLEVETVQASDVIVIDPDAGSSGAPVSKEPFTLEIPEIPGGEGQGEIPGLDFGKLTLDDAKEKQKELNEAIDKYKAGLQSAGVDISGDEDSLVTSIVNTKTELIARKLQLEDGLAELEKAIEAAPEQKKQLLEGLNQISAGKTSLESGREQLLIAQNQLQAAKAQIASGQVSAAEAVAELNRQKISATIELAAGKAEISTGEKELETARNQLDAQKDTAYDNADLNGILTMEMLKGMLAAQNFTMPAGYVTEEGREYLVRVGDKFRDSEDMGNLVLLDMQISGLAPIRISDVADVTVLDDSDEVYAKINGHAGILFTMQKQSGYSTGEVSKRLKERFQKLEEKNERIHIVQLMDQGVYIDLVVDSVLENMIYGAVLAVLVLLLFLKSFRPTLVIACSIPISIMVAIVLMYFTGINLNIISLSGLALGIGMLVDNSIVVIENIYRLKALGEPVKRAAVEGAKQVGGAIAASTLTTICVFVPIVFTKGITRQLFVDMGLTIAYSLLASLLIALTLVPMMAAGLLKRKVKEKPGRMFDSLQNLYAKLLRISLKGKPVVLLLALALLVVSTLLSVSRGTEFMPQMESTQISATLTMPEETSLEDTGNMTDEVVGRIMEISDVKDVGAMADNGGMSMTGGKDNQTSLYILLSEEKEKSNAEIVREIRERTKDLNCELMIQESSMDTSALGGSGISIKIKGRNLDSLKETAEEIARMVEKIQGTKEVSDGIEEETLELRLTVDKNKAVQYQLTTAQIFQFLQGKLAEAASATTLSTDVKDYSVFLLNEEDSRLTREDIKKLTIEGKDADGKAVEVPLRELVEFQDTEGFSSINREAQTRYVTVTADIAEGYNIGLVAREVQKKLDAFEVPEGLSIEMAGEDETIKEAMGEVMKMLALALIFMYLIMVAQFQSLLSPFIIMFTIPLAFTGGFLGLYFTGKPVSVIAMIGFVMLSGIIVNNGIVLVDYINQLRREGMEKREAIVEAGRTRLRPIFMTALTTILGLLTMAMGIGMGADMIQPMAIVTIGGLLYGTLLTLFVVPCIYDLLNRKKDIKEEEF